jgi:hypothetical protein
MHTDIRLLDKFFFADTARISVVVGIAAAAAAAATALDRQRYESRLLAVGIVFVGAGRRSRRAVDTRALAPAEPAVGFLALAVADVQRLDGRRVGVAVHFVGADELD